MREKGVNNERTAAGCQAHSKRSHQRCRNWALRGKKVCRFHGGKSTGPNTFEGRKTVARTHFKRGLHSKAYRKQLVDIKDFIRKSRLFISRFN